MIIFLLLTYSNRQHINQEDAPNVNSVEVNNANNARETIHSTTLISMMANPHPPQITTMATAMPAHDLAGARRSPITGRSEWHPQGVSHVASALLHGNTFCGRPRTSPPPLLVKSVDHGDHPVAPSLCVRRIHAMIFVGRG